MSDILAKRSAAVLLAVGVALAGCGGGTPSTIPLTGQTKEAIPTGPGAGQQGAVKGFLGGVVADEPLAALTARNVLAQGGNAADAVVAGGLAMTVSYPSRASLGAGGACVVFSPKRGAGPGPEAILFPVTAPSAPVGADRPAGVPMMARGLYLLSARFGRAPFEALVTPAEQMARAGIGVSRAFVQDLRIVAGPLRGDPVAASVFLPGGQPLAEGQNLVQPDLAATLAGLRVSGVGDFYQGGMARQFVEAAQAAGGGLASEDLRNALPRMASPLVVPVTSADSAFFAPTDGGLATAVALKALLANNADLDGARNAALAAAAQFRRQGGDPAAILTQGSQSGAGLPMLPATAAIVAIDREGQAVMCNFTMNNLFGTGRIAGRSGVLLAASPKSQPAGLLAGGIVVNPNLTAFRAVASGTGQEGAPVAAAVGLLNAVRGGAVPVPDPGRTNLMACGRYLPGSEESCGWSNDPRGFGLALGSN